MKYFISACVFFFVATQTVSALDKCIAQAECESYECCTGVPPFGGLCRNLTAEGGKCHLEDKTVPIFGDFYVGGCCPCEAGLICVQQGKKKNDGICQLPPTTAAPTAAVEVPAEEPVEEPAVVPAEEPAEEPAEVPAEEPAEVPAEEPAEVPAEEPASDDTAAEEPAAEAGDSSASDAAAEAGDGSASDAAAE